MVPVPVSQHVFPLDLDRTEVVNGNGMEDTSYETPDLRIHGTTDLRIYQ